MVNIKEDKFFEKFFKKHGNETPLLYAVYCVKYKSSKPANTENIYKAYKLICKELDTESLTKGCIGRIISRLVKSTILNEKVVSSERFGKTRIISFDIPKQMITEVGNSMNEFIAKGELEKLAKKIRESLK